MNEAPVDPRAAEATLAPLPHRPQTPLAAAVIYLVAFVTGAIVMSFEMLGSRYLNPYFGSGIYTWAALISTVLAALTAGYFLGGWLADRTASPRCWALTVLAPRSISWCCRDFPTPCSTMCWPTSTTCGPGAWWRRSRSCSFR